MSSEVILQELENLQEFQTQEEQSKATTHNELKVNKKAWIMRISLLISLIFLMVNNILVALEIGDSLIFYSTLMPIQTVSIFFIGWFFFKNYSKGKNIKSKDLVSVIIPIYNQKYLIHKVIDAISNSTYKNIEIIAVNDGSNDGTHEILDYLEHIYSKLKVIHQKNGGKRRAVAKGFENSCGKYLVLIDSDSIVDKNAINEFMKTFQSYPDVGAVVGNGKVLNKNKNVLTRCQDAWYDYAFNIHKTTESVFGTVLCCSGCLAAYRREAIDQFIPFWVKAKVQNSDDRDLTTYAIATSWGKKELAPIKNKLMESMANYDDSEDRGLTAYTLKEWKTVYIPSAIVHTEVPEKPKAYIRQQTRWKKGYLRSNFFVSAFFWRKNPFISLIFYVELMSTFISPLILFVVYFYTPFVLNNYVLPITYLAGQLMIGIIAGLDYKFREPKNKTWKYKPIMNLVASFILPWLLFPAIITFRKNQWLTR
jgi:hyaluronan synthase